MESVAEIDLSGNRLTGTLPDLHHLQKLRVLLVDDQRLSGTFPPGLAKAPSLEGAIPKHEFLSREFMIERRLFDKSVTRSWTFSTVNNAKEAA